MFGIDGGYYPSFASVAFVHNDVRITSSLSDLIL
jgi:hypothetical protein